MKPRPSPMPRPSGHRYWCLDLTQWLCDQCEACRVLIESADEEQREVIARQLDGLERSQPMGEHHFRMPRYSVAFSLIRLASSINAPTDYVGSTIAMLPLFGAVVGSCWCHRGKALETPAPTTSSPAALAEYGEAVVDELQDAYTLDEIRAMFLAAMPEIQRRLDVVGMAAQRADFFEEPGSGREAASR